MEDRLLKYQLPHFYQLEEILTTNNCALDASDTGTGKTYVAVALAFVLKRLLFIICPKSVIPNWLNVAKTLGVEILGIANYELIKGCKYYTEDLVKVNCTYVEKYLKEQIGTKEVYDYTFSLPDDVLVIVDEAHRCKNHQSITSRLLLAIHRSKCKMLLLSATISDKVKCFKPFGVVFGFYDNVNEFKMWVRKTKAARQIYYKNSNLNDDQMTLDIIHTKLFPDLGSRMRIKDLGSMFPSNQVLSQSYMSDNMEEIQEQYEIIQEAFRDLKS